MGRDKSCTCATSMHAQFLNAREVEVSAWVGRDGMGQRRTHPLSPSQMLGSPSSLHSLASSSMGHLQLP